MIKIRKYYPLVLLLSLVLLIACKNETQHSIPENIIEDEVFISVLVDMHLANSQSLLNNIDGMSQKRQLEILHNYVFSKHNIERADYDSTISYYMKYPNRYSELYESVLNKLSKIEGEIKEDSLDTW